MKNKKGKAPNKENGVCGKIKKKDIDGSSVLEVECNTKGRYLSISLPGRQYLTLCEVKLYKGECDEGIVMRVN